MRLGRVAEISKVFVEEGLGWSTDAPLRPSNDTERAARLRRALERLGPTFVKFGQLLGTRVDLFSEEFLQELRKLRTHVPPFSAEAAKKIIEEELGKPVSEVFSEFPEEPIASASIAQVYRARLRETDAWVAVKVQRPGLTQNLLSDLDVLMEVSGFVDRLVPAYHRSMVHRVAAEYASRARTEINFLAEANAIERFNEVLTTLPDFRVPYVVFELCTSKLLVMEWFPGTLLDRIQTRDQMIEMGISPASFASSMLRLQLGMSYEHGFVHGDTHPGNIVLLESGHIGLIDFGLHGQVPRQLCDKMLELLFYQSSGRTEEALQAFLEVFTPTSQERPEGFEDELRAVLAQSNAPTAKESRLTAQLVEGLRVGAKYQLQARSELFIVIRNLTIVEGIVLQFCPDLDVLSEVRHIVHDIVQRRAFGTRMQAEVQQLMPMLMLTLSQRPQLAERVLRLERSFTESRNLGDFLRREDVLSTQEVPQSRPGWVFAVLGTLGGAALASAAWWWSL